MQVLPSSSSHTEQRLAEVQQELAALDAQQAAVGRRSRWRRHGFIWAGLSSQVLLWGLLFRLTFYELSWDVMEPICFFVSGVQALVSENAPPPWGVPSGVRRGGSACRSVPGALCLV